jgi:hypothetical protein
VSFDGARRERIAAPLTDSTPTGADTMTTTTASRTLRALCPDARRGWHLIGEGPARFGWATYTAAGDGTWLGRTASEALEGDAFPQYRAYDVTTEWQGPRRFLVADAERDAMRHNAGCRAQGGYGRAVVVQRSGDRCAHLDGNPVWPSHGRSCGAARWSY